MRRGSTAGFGLAAILAAGIAAADTREPWRVLILQTTEAFNPGALATEEALCTELVAQAGRPVAFHVEYLDSVSFDTTRFEPELLALFRKKYAEVNMDLVAPIGPNALDFVQRHRQEMWPQAPVVFTAISEVVPALTAGSTGVTIAFDESGTLALARRLRPSARRLLLIAGASDYDRGWWRLLVEAVRGQGEGLEVTYSFGEPLPDVLAAVSRLPQDAIVLYTTIGRDGRGEPYLPRDVAVQLSRASPVPVFAVIDTQLGYGVVGGSMPSLAEQGRRAAALALRVLNGEKAASIPVEPPPAAVAMLDWRQLRRFGIAERLLPQGAEVHFRTPSFWDEYAPYVAAVAAVLAVQTALIAALLVQSRRRRQAELDAQRQRAELAHASRLSAVGQLTASIAHEINQPLGAILSNAEAAEMFLDAEPPALDRVRQILADIGHEDRRASDVIRHVRSLLSKAPPELQPLALNDVARDVLELVAGNAARRGVALQSELAAGLPAIQGDRVQLQQALLNLVLNGLEALERSPDAERRVVVRTSRGHGAWVELVVADTGPGIQTQDLQRLFESFYTTKKEGMGLGLSIVRSILDAHGGGIEVGSNGGRGALFRLRLPALVGDPPRSGGV